MEPVAGEIAGEFAKEFAGEILSIPSPRCSAVSACLQQQNGLIPSRVIPACVFLERLASDEDGWMKNQGCFALGKPFSQQLSGLFKAFQVAEHIQTGVSKRDAPGTGL